MARRKKKNVQPSKVVRLDLEVIEYLSLISEPLVDTPNTVIRMILGLDKRSRYFKRAWGYGYIL